jgi:hypothetical protein
VTTDTDIAALIAFAEARLTEAEKQAGKLLEIAREAIEALKGPRFLGRVMPGWHSWPDVEAMSSRALLDVAAKRLVLAEHEPFVSIYGMTCGRCVSWRDSPWADGGETEFGIAIPDPWPCVPVRGALASWGDHAEFRPEWRLAQPTAAAR